MKMFLFILLNLVCISSFGQKHLPGFGKVSEEELEMKDCSFDPGAVAIKLIDYGKLVYDRGLEGMTLFKTKYEFRTRIKILKKEGFDLANVEIPFYAYNNDEKIWDIDACTINKDENGKASVINVGKANISTRKINKRISKLVIVFPEIKEGCIIEYRYKLDRDAFTSIKSWYFQQNIPTRYSEYDINVPAMLRFSTQPTITGFMDVQTTTDDDVINVGGNAYRFKMIRKRFIMKDLPGIGTEPYMGSADDYKQRVDFELSKIDMGNNQVTNLKSTWSDVAEILSADEDFGKQLIKPVPEADALINTAKQITDPRSRARFLFRQVNARFKKVNEDEIFADKGISHALMKSEGNRADANLLLVALCQKSGLKSFPILMSTRENGLVNTLNTSLRQFNRVYCYIEDGQDFLVLDAADAYSVFGLIPPDVVNTRGFIVNPAVAKWIDITDNKHKYAMIIALQGDVDANGLMKGTCSISSSDYCKAEHKAAYYKGIEEFKKEYYQTPYPSVTMDDYQVKNLDADSLPLTENIGFHSQLSESGNYRYFNTNYFNGFDKNPFIAVARKADVDFGYVQDYTIYGNFTIPEDYEFDVLPRNIELLMDGSQTKFSRVYNVSGNVLDMRVVISMPETFYPAASYDDLREFFSKMIYSLNEQIIIKKK